MLKEIILHIGGEKTGSTTIQSFLSLNRQMLSAQRFIYPLVFGDNQIKIALASVGTDGSGMPVDSPVKRSFQHSRVELSQRLREEIEEMVKGGVADKLILSAEHFHSRLMRPADLINLLSMLPRSETIKAIWYIRRQDRAAVSLYSTWVKAGNYGAFTFPRVNPGNLPYRYNYLQAYEIWRSALGSQSVTVRTFDDVGCRGGLLMDFCDACDLAWNPEFHVPEAKNRSLDVNGIYTTQILNSYLNSSASSPKSGIKRLMKFISNNFCEGLASIPSKAQAECFYSNFRTINNTLRELCFPEQDLLFDEDFNEYPESAIQPEVDHEVILSKLFDYILRSGANSL